MYNRYEQLENKVLGVFSAILILVFIVATLFMSFILFKFIYISKDIKSKKELVENKKIEIIAEIQQYSELMPIYLSTTEKMSASQEYAEQMESVQKAYTVLKQKLYNKDFAKVNEAKDLLDEEVNRLVGLIGESVEYEEIRQMTNVINTSREEYEKAKTEYNALIGESPEVLIAKLYKYEQYE